MQEEKGKKRPSVYFMVPAPVGISPGQRFRFEHFLPLLKEKGIKYRISSFYSTTGWKTIFTPGNKFRKAAVVIKGLCKRILDLFRMGSCSFVFIYREAAPAGPPFFEWIIAKLLRKKIIYDFDDAIWVPVVSEYNRAVAFFKNFGKVAKICRWSYKVSVGNEYLATFARRYNDQVYIVPTVVNTEEVHNKLQDHEAKQPAVGWTGTCSTLPYLDMVLPMLKELQETVDFTFIVIADIDPRLPLKNYRFIKWNRETEAADLLNFHIGLMPLYDDEISRGKCGFKAIQYMSLGIPAIVSPVGVNSKIVDNGINGFVSNEDNEWKESLLYLLNNKAARQEMGTAARKKIQDSYSVSSAAPLFLDLVDYNQ